MMENLVKKGKTVVSSAIFRRMPEEGERITVDKHNGMIFH